MVSVVEEVVDDGEFLELFPNYAENIIIGFARLDGRSIGVVGNQPNVLAGCLDIDASIKAARFIRLAMPSTSHSLPSRMFLVPSRRCSGMGRHHSTRCETPVRICRSNRSKLTLVTRKAYGGAYLAMSCKHLQSDYNVAWPTAELAVMGAEGL